MIKCCRCQEVKEPNLFDKNANTKTGYAALCKVCRKANYQRFKSKRQEEAKTHYHKDVDTKRLMLAQNKRWYAISRGSPKESAELIFLDEIYVRDNGMCQVCNLKCEEVDATMDHIIECKRGGPHTKENVRLAHLECNQKRGRIYFEPPNQEV